jgi:hypothetical protein
VVVIASSDSDFAPLVQRLREKGCVVRGIGQKGKTGDETQDVYDDYTVLEHRKAEPAARAPRKTAARKTSTRKAAPPQAAEPAPAAEAPPAPPKKPAARKKPLARKAASSPDTTSDATSDALAGVMADILAESAAAPEPAAAPAKRARKTPARKAAQPAEKPVAPPAPPADPRVEQVLAVLPELAAGQSLALNVAVQRLREARLLGRNAPSTRFFAALAERFELVPAGSPTKVLLRS